MLKRKQQEETALAAPPRRDSRFKPKIIGLRWWMMLVIMLGSIVNYLARSTLTRSAGKVERWDML